MFYLNLYNNIQMNILSPSVASRPVVSRRVPSCPVVRPVVVVVVLCPSVRPVARPVVVVRPLSVRPRPSVVVVRPLSVRAVVRPVVVVRPLSVRPVVRLNITCKTSRNIK